MCKFKIGDVVIYNSTVYTITNEGPSYGSYQLDNRLIVFADTLSLYPPKAPPHKHAALIKAWADNPKTQFQYRNNDEEDWENCGFGGPSWYPHLEYRIKPEPKPDIVKYTNALCTNKRGGFTTYWGDSPLCTGNMKATFDGETGKLKSVEMI